MLERASMGTLAGELERVRASGLRKVEEKDKRYADVQCIDEPMHQICLSDDPEAERRDGWRNALYLGSRDGASLPEALEVRNIRTVLSVLASDVPSPEPRAPGVEYWRSPAIDDAATPEAAAIMEALVDEVPARIDAALATGSSVLLHCQWGISRSATVATAYVMRRQGLGRKEALERVRACRRVARPNAAFLEVLDALEARLATERVAP